jgi:hypothetical protein
MAENLDNRLLPASVVCSFFRWLGRLWRCSFTIHYSVGIYVGSFFCYSYGLLKSSQVLHTFQGWYSVVCGGLFRVPLRLPESGGVQSKCEEAGSLIVTDWRDPVTSCRENTFVVKLDVKAPIKVRSLSD